MNTLKRISGRLLLAIAVPVILLALAEGLLRAGSYGIYPHFVVRGEQNGRTVHHDNQDIGTLWFSPGMTRAPVPFLVPEKTNDLRIVIIGESAAMGDPAPGFGLAPHLEAVLRRRYPEKSIEVINCAMTAIDSSILVQIARDLAPLKPDAVVVYMGNNEVVGPFGPGSGDQASFRLNAGYARFSLWSRSLRIGQLMRRTWSRFVPLTEQSWQGLGQFSNRTIAPDSVVLPKIHQRFEKNKNAIVSAIRSHGAEPVVCTMATRPLWPPFIGADAAEWHYRRARELIASGDVEGSLAAHRTSRDLDRLRFRADSSINRTLSREMNPGTMTVDLEKVFETRWREPARYFWDHVHLTPEGNYVAAVEIAKALEQKADTFRLGPAQSMPAFEEINQDILFTIWDRLNTAALMHARLLRPPFTDMPDYSTIIGPVTKEVSDLRDTITRENVENIRDKLEDAAQKRPDDFALLGRIFRIHEELEEYTRACEAAEAIMRIWPHVRSGHNLIGRCLIRAGRIDDAIKQFEQSEIPGTKRPRVVARIEAASMLAESGNFNEALKLLGQVLEMDPSYAKAWYNQALIRGRIGQVQQAEGDLRKALQWEPSMAEALNNLGVLALKQGRNDDAERYFRRAIEQVPTHISALRNLAMVTMMKGDGETARACSEKLTYLDPDLSQVSALQKVPAKKTTSGTAP
jgi:tetratricopeptide (TPR) repeat protein